MESTPERPNLERIERLIEFPPRLQICACENSPCEDSSAIKWRGYLLAMCADDEDHAHPLIEVFESCAALLAHCKRLEGELRNAHAHWDGRPMNDVPRCGCSVCSTALTTEEEEQC